LESRDYLVTETEIELAGATLTLREFGLDRRYLRQPFHADVGSETQ
jgi:hypothetical protein